MPPQAKVAKLDKTQRLFLFCTTNTESTKTNCDPENNDEDKLPSFLHVVEELNLSLKPKTEHTQGC